MDDLALARDRLHRDKVNLVVVKDSCLLASSAEGGVRPLVQMVLQLGEEMQGAAVADKVVGRAAALLCCYAGVSAVYTPLASESARQELRAADIQIVADQIVAHILNRSGDGPCPFERLTEGKGPAEALAALRAFLGP
ncbi:MAG: DUF1893 domain-containing protein [Chloroflexi bacterium]|nr:DUF1893 domain-containing protein [Chloroflexota bacterium]MCL5074082.1 DUF1893 domain-containing protein [Chloroflexota bacterium]